MDKNSVKIDPQTGDVVCELPGLLEPGCMIVVTLSPAGAIEVATRAYPGDYPAFPIVYNDEDQRAAERAALVEIAAALRGAAR